MEKTWYERNKEKVLKKLKDRYRQDKEFREKAKKRYRDKYHSDPEYRENTKKRAIERYHKDEEYRKATIQRARKRSQLKKKDSDKKNWVLSPSSPVNILSGFSF